MDFRFQPLLATWSVPGQSGQHSKMLSQKLKDLQIIKENTLSVKAKTEFVLRALNWPGRMMLQQDPSAHVYSVLFLLVYISPEPWASHSYILSVPIHAQQATPPYQARSFS